jgi:hypothetical protein
MDQSTEIDVGGRPTKYKASFNKQAKKLCLLGATDAEIADFFEVTESTVNNWKIEYPKFLESIKQGKLIADANVADSLYRSAVGYEHPAVEIKVVSQGAGSPSKIECVPVRKKYPPNEKAASYWLNNRRKHAVNDWRQRIDHTTDGKPIEAMSNEELAAGIVEAMRELNGTNVDA